MAHNHDKLMKERIGFLEEKLRSLTLELDEKNRKIGVEKAFEKVRGKALEMQSSSQLSDTSAELFQQLKELNIEVIRSGVGIFDDENNAIELWITSVSESQEVVFILDYVNIHIHRVFENIIAARDAKKPFALTKLEGRELLNYYSTMSAYMSLPLTNEKNYSEFFYSFFFGAGSFNVITRQQLTDEEVNIMLRLTQVFGLIYTRFLDLKKAEKQSAVIEDEKQKLEETLKNLQATQSQLIQSEKMASLGVLTAGIAHEIQNPLNFVNNFSEVSNELLNEISEELAAVNEQLANTNLQNAIEISNDVKQNLEKILHHGKRASDIVKGMLQHSRSGSGQKESTDINALCNEYLRLAYHGLRAKDKTFTATMETDFDDTIGKVAVIPQDIGRVILNLVTNAFYAVNEKQKAIDRGGSNPDSQREARGVAAYVPTVTMVTKNLTGKIEIRVKDNGNGIATQIVDKIFQPFFTTKPTGQGTGLGLSLAYDIVKAHGGELKVSTKQNHYAEFIIELPFEGKS